MKYCFYTFSDYWKNEDNTVYGVGLSNFSGWYRKITLKIRNITKDEAELQMKKYNNKNCNYIPEDKYTEGRLPKEWYLSN